jgi:acyl-coenzyme A synthetase/AMP-(fatty) acid ligase
MVADQDGMRLGVGRKGELCVSGSSVMQGYWNLPEQTARVFFSDRSGDRWYRTGDVVVEQPDGVYRYLGRKDRMVKRRGYRVELGEIEAALHRHPNVREAGVVAFANDDSSICIKAFINYSGAKQPSIIEMKRFCSEILPLYMVPDLFCFQGELPKTSTAKIDYQRLKESP